ncbi:MAG: UDP-N-acetylglucosamine 2-epimerase (non-hydrolyzing) [Planctomycetes bacterium]|nr:UDP-N-acetylglucosamine 2-epimerase (non-hydrolyzing) [Planctomycetota bacterium]
MIKVLSVFGTRPEAIKMAPVVQELRRRDGVHSWVCVTAQHRRMLDQALSLFEIVPDHDLDVMVENQTPSRVASSVLERLEPILAERRPDWVLVQGDTVSAAAAAMGAFYAGARVAHVEAGLRTRDPRRPFPEEMNRRVAGVVADVHFAPTARARRNLLEEGVATERIFVTGNPVIDALRAIARRPEPDEVSALVPHRSSRLIVVTAHRRENFGAPLENICAALAEIARRAAAEVRIVYPVHPNPRVREATDRLLRGIPTLSLIPPLEYLPMVHLLKQAYLILTDSGGLQEEAPGLGVPVLVLRDVTERPEGIEAGTVRLVGTDRDRIIGETMRLLEDRVARDAMATAVNPYGDGQAARRIVAALLGEPVDPFVPR